MLMMLEIAQILACYAMVLILAAAAAWLRAAKRPLVDGPIRISRASSPWARIGRQLLVASFLVSILAAGCGAASWMTP